MTGDTSHHFRGYDFSDSLWGRLGERFGLVALRPKLHADVRVRRVDDEIELVQLSSGRVVSLSETDVRLVRQFDGSLTISEMIVSELGTERRLMIQPVLELIDRVVRAEMLDNFPPNMFRQIERHLVKRAMAEPRPRSDADRDAAEGEADGPVSQFEQMPWRPRTPLLAERAQFLRSVELLKPLDIWSIGALAEAAHEEAHPAASNIVTEGQTADRFFIVRSGDVNVTKIGEDGKPKRIAKLGPGDCFGEAGLLDSSVRSASVRAGPSRPVQVYSFDASVFERIISPHISNFRGRQSASKRLRRLEKVPLLADLSQDDLARLAEAVREHRAPSGTTIFQQGDVGDKFYIVIEGAVGIVRDGVPVAKIGEGEFFGETALLFTSERTATVITTEDSLLWSIDKLSFTRMVRDALLNRRDMMPTVLNRISN